MAESRTEKSESGSQQANLATRSPSGGLGIGNEREPWDEASPFAFMQRLMSEMDSLFSDFGFGRTALPSQGRTAGASMWLPQVDVTTRDGQLLVHADLPGLKQDDVKVTVHEGMLTISGERGDTHEEKRGGVFRRERSYGSFRRQIALPEGVDPESIKAHFENGVLEVSMPMPKEAPQQGRTIPIQPKAASGPDVH